MSNIDLNERLATFLVKNLSWRSLNKIQEMAFPLVSNGNDCLIIAPTASGKTEAALLPIFNEILTKNLKSTSVLYISPLKALINDMDNRISKWARYFDLSVTKWHGDVTKNNKDNFIKNPTDFLLITPESLEVIFIHRSEKDRKRIFENIKYIIIDEIHYFANSDRGIQLNSLINRVLDFADDVCVVGLSATVGNPKLIAEWINPKKPAKIIRYEDSNSFDFKLRYLSEENFFKTIEKNKYRKLLIFVKSRACVEYYHDILKEKFKINNIFVHHSSVNKDIREENEEKFKAVDNGIMISTSTLELGIDIGNIDIVIQLNPPYNISSFLQRIGRSGRKSLKRRTIILSNEWDILITLAEIILINENVIEDIFISKKSKDILFHQILSHILEHGKVSLNKTYTHLTSCYSFSDISKDEYKSILDTMVDKKFIHNNHGYLTLDYKFEEIFGSYNFINFFTVFCPNYEFKVKEGKKEIGTINIAYALILKIGVSFILSGQQWEVIGIDYGNSTIYVTGIKKNLKEIPRWTGTGESLSYIICQKVRDILLGNYDFSLLKRCDEQIVEIILKAQDNAKNAGFREGIIPITIDNHKVVIYTFAGDDANFLLLNIFKLYYKVTFERITPFYCSFNVNEDITLDSIEDILYNVENILSEYNKINLVKDISNKFFKNKFIKYLPINDELDLKFNLMFDEESLIKVCSENSVVEIDYIDFDSWFSLE